MNEARQRMQETGLEHQTRKDNDFEGVEHKLPTIWSKLSNIPIKDDFTSLLGSHNPFAHPASPEEHEVWLLDNTAYRPVHPYHTDPQPWQAEFLSCFFLKHTGKGLAKAVAKVADELGLAGDSEPEKQSRETITRRLRPFASTVAPARTVTIQYPDGKGELLLGPSDRSGIGLETKLTLDGGDHQVLTPLAEGFPGPRASMKTYFASPEGWGFISDIDDSIKITKTAQPTGILQTTFVDEPQPIEGMPELYAQINKLYDPTWFYL